MFCEIDAKRVIAENELTWNEANCADAFDALAQTPSTESYQEVGISLRYINLAYAEFVEWLRGRGFPDQSFWKLPLEKPKRGRPPEYNWPGVKGQLKIYVTENGPMQTLEELLQKCTDFATDLHPMKKTPNEATIRAAIETHALDAAAGFTPGK